MRTPTKVVSFIAGLAVVFTAALGVGRAVGPSPGGSVAVHESSGHDAGEQATAVSSALIPGGLQVAQDGYRLVPTSGELSVGTATPFTFQIIGPDGVAVREYTASHEKDLHLNVVRRDLSNFQHLHPQLGPDGTWSVPLTVAAAGQYRVFADFQPAARTKALTLGLDVAAPGDYRPTPLPPTGRTTTVDGYTVTVTGDLVPGTASKLTLTVRKDGAPISDLQPYLGAYGHLVVLRDGDAAYLHVHPDGAPGDGKTAAGPDITFYADVPTEGRYRLFLDFRHAGVVRTAEFTSVAGTAVAAGGSAPTASTPATHGEDGHSDD